MLISVSAKVCYTRTCPHVLPYTLAVNQQSKEIVLEEIYTRDDVYVTIY
jgi:hypothetical protein